MATLRVAGKEARAAGGGWWWWRGERAMIGRALMLGGGCEEWKGVCLVLAGWLAGGDVNGCG
jgi:hypothetical protein